MITVINKTNKGLYNQLFAQVQDWLSKHDAEGREVEAYSANALLGLVKDENGQLVVDEEGNNIPETITSLEEFYSFMATITNTPALEIYTRLPLDEPPFFIDANKRTIEVPKDFAANGVSVQGDEIAEILFFKIDRFFDATDLNECDIYVQWRSSELDGNGKPKEGVSKTWIKDIESEPGYLIFGWPITSKITNTAGNITFSVRFYRMNEANKLVYSFSTLDQTVTIKPALDYNIENIVNEVSSILEEDATGLIMERAVNTSSFAGNTAPEMPYWEDGIEEGLQGFTVVLKNDGETVKYQIMNLGVDDRGFSTQPIHLKAAALSNDSGVVIHKWLKLVYGNDPDGEVKITTSDGTTRFAKVVDYDTDIKETDALSNKTYYYKDGDAFKPIVIPAGSSTPPSIAELIEEYEEVYQLVATAIIDETGKYVASASNRVGKSVSEALVADAIYVPYPKAPELENDGVIQLLGTDAQPILKEDAEDAVVLGIDFALKDEFDNRVEEHGGKATYQWNRYPLNTEDNEKTPVGTDEQLLLTYEDDEEGWYEVVVTNNLNKETASTTSEKLRITHMPVALTVELARAEDDVRSEDAHNNGLGIKQDVVEASAEPYRTDEDSITYKWYRYAENTGDFDIDKEAAKRYEYVINGDIPIEDIGGEYADIVANEATFYPPANVAGVFFCEVTNTYNGSTTKVLSPFYNVQNV